MSDTLWDIGTEMENLKRIHDAEDEIAEERWFNNWFESLKDRLHEKADNYVALIQDYTARAKARKEEAKRLSDRAAIDLNNARRLKDRLQEFLEAHEMKSLETTRFKLTVANNGGKLPMHIPEDVSRIDKAYVKLIAVADKEKIREDLESGKTIEGCAIGERGKSLRIK